VRNNLRIIIYIKQKLFITDSIIYANLFVMLDLSHRF